MGSSNTITARRVLLTAAATTSMVLLGALPASAAPPSHDTIAQAKVISAVPFSETVDTTEATTDADDTQINANCGAPATNGSVWYSLTATAPGYLVNVAQSDFSAGVIVATGTPGNLELVTCGPRTVGFEATAGTTYFLMAFSDTPEVVGGQLAISVTEASPPPKVSMIVDRVGRVNTRTGVATVSGRYTCDGQANVVFVQGTLSQRRTGGGENIIGNFEQGDLKCGGTFRWSAEVVSENGKFKRGEAATISVVVGCAELGCNFYETLDVVHLRGGHQ